MYWPIGAPRIYAASNSKSLEEERVFESDDDAESREITEDSGSLELEGKQEVEREAGSGATTPIIPLTPGIKPVEHDTHRRPHPRSFAYESSASGAPDKEPLLALKISRIGHLFAVITSTSLTIWQSKVHHPENCCTLL